LPTAGNYDRITREARTVAGYYNRQLVHFLGRTSGLKPRRNIAADNRPVNPVRSASNRNGTAPTWATNRSSSATSSNPRAR